MNNPPGLARCPRVEWAENRFRGLLGPTDGFGRVQPTPLGMRPRLTPKSRSAMLPAMLARHLLGSSLALLLALPPRLVAAGPAGEEDAESLWEVQLAPFQGRLCECGEPLDGLKEGPLDTARRDLDEVLMCPLREPDEA